MYMYTRIAMSITTVKEQAQVKIIYSSSSSSIMQYVYDCANCKGSSWYAYGNVRRHCSIFGINTKADVRVAPLPFQGLL